jgi:uncharacterized protein (DUF433 family)
MSGEPCIDNHRITTNLIASVWWDGEYDLKYITSNWELDKGSVLVACYYEARYGSRIWRKRWKEWLKDNEGILWNGYYSSCPMPPRINDKVTI